MSLKNGKKSHLARNGPFSQILSHNYKQGGSLRSLPSLLDSSIMGHVASRGYYYCSVAKTMYTLYTCVLEQSIEHAQLCYQLSARTVFVRVPGEF